MKSSLESHQLLLALQYICKKIAKFEYFIFYGTLVGVMRDGKPVEGDDDIDIMVPAKYREQILALFLSDNTSDLEYDESRVINQTPYFSQILMKIYTVSVPIDFYFFDRSDTHVVDKWSQSAWSRGITPLSIPIELIYPLKSVSVGNAILNVPRYPEACCEFIYGSEWRIPKSKWFHYETYLEDGVIKVRQPSLRRRLAFRFPFLRKVWRTLKLLCDKFI
jgi:hypothetical protein